MMTGKATKTVVADRISTRVSVIGRGEPLLMFSPGGFDATLEKWSESGDLQKIDIMHYLAERFTCILFDRRECGESGGRLEILDFSGMARHGRAVMEQLGFESVHLLGGCLGCAPAAEFARLYPEMTQSLNLVWPVGGAKYRIRNFGRFATHLGWVTEHGKGALIERALASDVGFAKDSTLGPWGGTLRVDAGARGLSFKACDRGGLPDWYRQATGLCSIATALGPSPERLMESRHRWGSFRATTRATHGRRLTFFRECISHATFLDHRLARKPATQCLPFLMTCIRSSLSGRELIDKSSPPPWWGEDLCRRPDSISSLSLLVWCDPVR